MQLGHDADRCRSPVDRDHRLDADLEVVSDPDHARVDGAGRAVPEVSVFETGVWKLASTSGMRWLMKSGSLRSITLDLR